MDEVVTLGHLAAVPANTALAGRAVDLQILHPTLLSPRKVVSVISSALGSNFSFAGGPAALIPRKYTAESDMDFIDALLRHLMKSDTIRYDVLEIVAQNALPKVRTGENIDFFIQNTDKSAYRVMYRTPGRISYRDSGATIQVSMPPVQKVERTVPATSVRIKSGEPLKITLVSGGVSVLLEGVALESGTGEIKVRIEETGREIVARITGEREVLFEL